MRDGRLCDWTLRTCGRPAAAAYLRRTPTVWSAFATRNAELGRRLADAH